jgi:hypothetical protein
VSDSESDGIVTRANLDQADDMLQQRSPDSQVHGDVISFVSDGSAQANKKSETPVSKGYFLRELQQRIMVDQPQSPLLRLPGELHNRIYDFALSADEPLFFKQGTRYTRSVFIEVTDKEDDAQNSRNGLEEFNQLKFVCRQLYAETACLELKASSVSFQGEFGGLDRGPAYAFIKFFKQLEGSKCFKLKHVELDFTRSDMVMLGLIEDLGILCQLAEICKAFPHMLVEYTVRDLKTRKAGHAKDASPSPLGPLHFMIHAIWLCYLFRSIDMCRLLPGIRLEDSICLRELSDKNTGELESYKPLDLPNLKLKLGEKVLSETFKEDLRQNMERWPLTITEEHLDACVKQAKDWVENGI